MSKYSFLYLSFNTACKVKGRIMFIHVSNSEPIGSILLQTKHLYLSGLERRSDFMCFTKFYRTPLTNNLRTVGFKWAWFSDQGFQASTGYLTKDLYIRCERTKTWTLNLYRQHDEDTCNTSHYYSYRWQWYGGQTTLTQKPCSPWVFKVSNKDRT